MHAIDTSVLFYALDPRSTAKREAALRMVGTASGLALPWQALCELANGFRKLERLGVPRKEARLFLDNLQHRHPVLFPRLEALDLALDIEERFSISFWDANLVAACVVGGAEILYSEDIACALEIHGLKLVNPFAASRR
jgi:predicted nucleic acid-binding protein